MRFLFPRATRWTLGVGLGLLASIVTFASCSKPSTDVSISVAPGLEGLAATAEFDVFSDSCPDEMSLEYGKFPAPAYSQSVACTGGSDDAGDGTCGDLSAPGNLSTGTYGFAVLLRDANCNTFAFGCETVDLSKVRQVTIPVDGIYSDEAKTMLYPVPLCSASQVCVDGTCTSGSSSDAGVDSGAGGSSGGSSGAGGSSGQGGSGGSAGKGGSSGAGGAGGSASCSFELLAHGKLPAPAGTGDSIIGPAVVSTGSGFVVAFEDVASNGATAQLAMLPVGFEGAMGNASTTQAQGCMGATFTDGFGMAFVSPSVGGLVATARPPCAADAMMDAGGGAGIALTPFSAGGQLQGSLLLEGNSSFPTITMSSPHAIATIPGTTNVRVSFVQSMTPYSFDVNPTPAPQTTYTAITSSKASTFAEEASSSAVISALADGPGDGGNALDLAVTPMGGTATTATRDGATAAQLIAFGQRTFLATKDSSGGVSWALVDGSAATVATSSAPISGAKGFDVAEVSDRLIVITGQNLGLSSTWVKGAAEMPGAMAEGTKSWTSMTIPELASFDGTQLAVAADQGRVIVAWASRGQLGATDPSGGFALFSCEP